jgi:tetratricopeptide (TPR) repeat protein
MTDPWTTLRAALAAGALLILPLAALPDRAGAQDVAGPYLAARIAGFNSDYAEAADLYDRLIAADADTPGVLEAALVVHAALGDVERAAEVATLLRDLGQPSQFADGALLVRDLDQARYVEAQDRLALGVGGALLDGLLSAWIAAAEGDVAGARARFEEMSENESFASIARLHEAYLLAMTGDYEGADAILSGEANGPLRLTTRGVLAHVQVLLQLDRAEDAAELLRVSRREVNSPELHTLAERVAAGEAVTYDFLTEARQGMAESYLTLAALLVGETSPAFALLNARAAQRLRPDLVDAVILTADILGEQDQHDLAAEALASVPADHPAFYAAEIERAEALLADDHDEAAVEVLRSLSRSHPDVQQVHAALGDTFRRLERFDEAAAAYDDAIRLDAVAGERWDWYLHYVRGIAHERRGRFDLAEPDFRRALELNPDHPLVLNYLGYSLVEERKNFDEALDMIERAVAARPDDGYITDSLAWVLYRLGRFEEAVAPMERAVELEPLDPIINDHLGDVLWMVGREREAEFQWRRAMSLEPEPEDAQRIRRKLEVGLDLVLEEEGGVGARDVAEE